MMASSLLIHNQTMLHLPLYLVSIFFAYRFVDGCSPSISVICLQVPAGFRNKLLLCAGTYASVKAVVHHGGHLVSLEQALLSELGG
jgi:hypothetical protein